MKSSPLDADVESILRLEEMMGWIDAEGQMMGLYIKIKRGGRSESCARPPNDGRQKEKKQDPLLHALSIHRKES